jgi:hypothetical protein
VVAHVARRGDPFLTEIANGSGCDRHQQRDDPETTPHRPAEQNGGGQGDRRHQKDDGHDRRQCRADQEAGADAETAHFLADLRFGQGDFAPHEILRIADGVLNHVCN